MNKLCQLLNIENEDLLFEQITTSFKDKGILLWDYFVNWEKVYKNIKPIEKELNLLNVLIGKENIEQEVFELIKEYPQVIKAFPFLIAYRDTQVSMLTDVTEFLYKDYDFKSRQLSNEDCQDLATFFIKSGLGDLVKDKKVKNLVDYVTGVEVGLDSNGRKNRGGTMMENIVETFVKKGASIGGGAVILPGIVIGSGAMVGAGAVVTKNISEPGIYAGNPAKRLKNK